MDESHLRSVRTDVEANLDRPDFEVVAARGRQIRRRRTAVAASGAALAVAVVVLAVVRPFDTVRTLPPVHQPPPKVDEAGASRVLADPDALVDPEVSRVNGAGDMLALVVVPDRGFRSGGEDCLTTEGSSAMRWVKADGATRAWVDRPRAIEPLADGFVVAAVPAACRSGDPAQARAYVVDGAGRLRGIRWTGDAEAVCATRPADERCVFDTATARGLVVDVPRRPQGTVPLDTGQEGTTWARSADSRRLYWRNGDSGWQSRASSLPAGEIVSASAAGRWGVLAGSTSLEYTSDNGRSWQTRDLTEALRPIRIADVDWTVTRSGVLLGVTQLVGRGDVLFRSTDAGWTRFVETDVRTQFGLVRPTVQGDAVYVVDDERWPVSTDDGATWRRTPALP